MEQRPSHRGSLYATRNDGSVGGFLNFALLGRMGKDFMNMYFSILTYATRGQ